MANWVHDDLNNRIEALSKEEVYALLAQAIQQGQLPVLEQDTAFVTMIKSIVDGQAYKIGFCTQAQYNQLAASGQLQQNAYYWITDDTTYEDLVAYIEEIAANIDEIAAKADLVDTKKLDKPAYVGTTVAAGIQIDTTGLFCVLYLDQTYQVWETYHIAIPNLTKDAFGSICYDVDGAEKQVIYTASNNCIAIQFIATANTQVPSGVLKICNVVNQ